MSVELLGLTEKSKKKLSDFLNGIQHNPQGEVAHQTPSMKQSLTSNGINNYVSGYYSGYFTIVDMSENGQKKIGIIDGGGSGKSYISVNNSLREYQDYISEPLSDNTTYDVYIEWDWDNNVVTQKIVPGSITPKRDCMTARVHAGRVRILASNMSITQLVRTDGAWKADSEYTGQFAVRWNSEGTGVIVSGGVVDIRMPIVEGTSIQTVSGTIYLNATHVNNVWNLSFGTTQGQCYIVIANIVSANEIVQDQFNTAYFGGRYWI